MSLIKPGFGIAALTGKLGGTVYARNRGGLYARAWADPMGTPTDDQTDKMDIWITMGSVWNDLNKQQVDMWAQFAKQIAHENKLGERMQLTAQQIFTECYTNAYLSGATPPTEPSNINDRPAITTVPTVTALADGTELTKYFFEGTEATLPGGGSGTIFIYTAPCLRPTIRNVNNQFRLIETTGLTDSTIDIFDPYKTKFGTLAEVGWLAHLKLRVIDNVSWLGSTRVLIDQLIANS